MRVNISKKMRVVLFYLGTIFLFSLYQQNFFFLTADINAQNIENLTSPIQLKGRNFDIEIEPESFSVLIKAKDGHSAYASKSSDKSDIAALQLKENVVSWEYPSKGIRVILELKDDYLGVDIFSEKVNSFTWPTISENVVAQLA